MSLFRTHVFEGARPGPRLLITGGVHGDEYEPIAAIRRLGRQIVPKNLTGRLTLAPVVNEAAFARGQRTADDGLDLARVCPGRADGSITERVACELAALIRDADYYIDLHTGGAALTVFPLAGYMLHVDERVLSEQRRMAKAFNLPLVWGTDPRLDGRSLSIARDALVPAIYAEFLGGGRFERQGVDDYVNGCRGVMIELGMLDESPRESPFESRVKHFIEDSREGSGHMQACYPAPHAGLFEPSVVLGQTIECGQSIGELYDPIRETAIPIHAVAGGLVVVLRTSYRVDANDSLAVVAPSY
jgi:predicted deacylase